AGRLAQMAPRAGNSEALVVEQPLNQQQCFDIFAAVEAASAGTLHRLQHGGFSLPGADDERVFGREGAYLPDAEKSPRRSGSDFLMSVARHCLPILIRFG